VHFGLNLRQLLRGMTQLIYHADLYILCQRQAL